MKVNVVVVQYYASDAELDALLLRFSRILAQEDIEPVISRIDIRKAEAVASGSLRFFDISAYLDGLSRIGSGQPVVLLNDTLFLKHPWRTYVTSMSRMLRPIFSLDVPCAGGAALPTQNVVVIDEQNPTRTHVGTFLVALNPSGRALFERLGSQLPAEEADLGRRWLQSLVSNNQALSLILMFLFSKDPHPLRWQDRKAIGLDESVVQRKKVAIAFEYMLSREVLRSGGLLWPVNGGRRQWLREQSELFVRKALKVLTLGRLGF